MNVAGLIFGLIGLILTFAGLFLLSLKSLLWICQPNEVLIFSGGRRTSGGRSLGYEIVKGGRRFRKPFIEKVDRIDLTNMIIELEARSAYTKGGIPVHVQGVANVKIAGHEPLLDNAIERFLGRSRTDVMLIAKSTLEGSLRGVLATLTPEQLNEDRSLFAEKLVQEVEQDMTALGLTVDTLKIQNITDDVQYLDSIGRIRNSNLLSSSRVAEAVAKADAAVRSAENNEREVEAQIAARVEIAKADAEKRLTDARSMRAAVVAEEQAVVAAQVAKTRAEIQVQQARIEQVRRQLEADVVQPAKAQCEAMEAQARAAVAPIEEDGKARADALRQLAKSWNAAGPQAREIFLLQKIEPIIAQLTDSIGNTRIEKVTVIDAPSGGGASDPRKLIALNEQVKELFGIDLVDKLGKLGEKPATVVTTVAAPVPPPADS
ncbi:MAG: flotillin family protein [Armatimonadetes bacterium]|nr:flotillin family protein [Armatimonadota bacterium]